MKLVRTLIHGYLYFPFFLAKLSGTGPFGRDSATYTASRPPSESNPLINSLHRHFVRQFHESSCSVASVVTIINALRTGENNHPLPITQADILKRVKVGHWKERMSEGGYNGRRGVPLPLLGKMVKASLLAYDIRHEYVETVLASETPDETERLKATLRNRLIEFQTVGNGLLIAHFNQGVFIPALGIPHISPVGGFDPGTGSVTILDVDAGHQGGAYQISFETFHKGLSFTYNPYFRHLGYKSGGYIYIRLY